MGGTAQHSTAQQAAQCGPCPSTHRRMRTCGQLFQDGAQTHRHAGAGVAQQHAQHGDQVLQAGGGGGRAGECSSKGPSVEQARQFTHTRWHCLFRDTKKRQTSTAGAAAEQTPGCVLACGSYQGDTCTTSASPKVMIALLTRPSTPSTCRQTGRQTKPPGANGRQIGD